MEPGQMSLRRGAALVSDGRYDEAVTAFEAAAQAEPAAAGPHIQKALCHLNLNQPEPARLSLEKAIELEPINPAPKLFLALTRSELGDQEGARQLLDEVKKLSPEHQAVDTVRALVNLRNQALEPAVRYLGGKPDLSLSSPIISRLVVEVEKLLLPGEIPMLRRAPALIPQDEEAPPAPGLVQQLGALPRSFLAWIDQSQGRKKWEKGLKYPPGSERRKTLLQEAVDRLRKARDADRSRFRADFYLAEALLYAAAPRSGESEWLGRLRESRESFLVSWRQEGENPYLLYYLGKVSLNLGEVHASTTYFERGLEKFAKFPEAHYGLGQGWLLRGDLHKARDYFAQALRSDTFIMRDRLHDLVHRFQTEPETLSLPAPEWEPELEPDSTPPPVEVPSEPPV
jgi:tetratricopeptide (TPR) repeat protein